MATYAVGDIQGCMSAFARLLDCVGFSPGKDKLWIVGDLVNRGPESLAVLRHVKSLGKSAVTVLGNHDLHLLAVSSGVTHLRKTDTLQEILTAGDRDDLLAWLRRRPLLHQEGRLVLVHAGLLPQWTVETAVSLAREVEEILGGDRFPDLLSTLYEKSVPGRWSNDLVGLSRAAVVTNVLTKLRVCTRDGDMNLGFKGELQHIPAGLMPWFKVPGRRNAGSTIVCGHWAALGLLLHDNVIALDTGCVWGRHLTAIRLEDRQMFQVSCVESSQ